MRMTQLFFLKTFIFNFQLSLISIVSSVMYNFFLLFIDIPYNLPKIFSRSLKVNYIVVCSSNVFQRFEKKKEISDKIFNLRIL